MYMQDFDKQDFSALLAAQDIDASDGALFAYTYKKKKHTNRTHRTIYIGISDMGIQTLDFIKRIVDARLDETWSRYIAFLGIDTAHTEYDSAKHFAI